MRILAEVHRSFAGYYCEEGDLVVMLADGSVDDDVDVLAALIDERTLSACRDPRGKPREPRIRTVSARYSFAQLKAWRDALFTSFLDRDGASSLGIDHALNRIVMSVTDGFSRSIADRAASSVAVPQDAYSVSVERNSVPEAACPNPNSPSTVRQCFRPAVPAGVQIRTCQNGGCQVIVNGSCTIGSANYLWNGTAWLPGYVTNSHCMPFQFEMESNYVYQPTMEIQSIVNMVGFEFVDPPGWPCGDRICRWSDSSWVYAFDVAPEAGKIARPTGYIGSIDISPSSSRFTVTSWSNSVQGMVVDKVGRTTGWTYGNVTSVCVDVNVSGGNKRLLCQNKASYPSDSGDSGSPVFQWSGLSTVNLLGIHWGSGASYSPWSNVRLDLGELWITP